MHLNPAVFGTPNTIELSSPLNVDNSKIIFGNSWLPSFSNDMQLYTPQFIISFDKLSVGYQYTFLDYGQLTRTEPGSSEPLVTYRSYEQNHNVSASYQINSNISIGAGINFIKSDLASGVVYQNGSTIKAAERIAFDIGIYGQKPFQTEQLIITPSLGWSLTDIGEPIRYTPDTQSDPLPIMMRGGLGIKIDTKSKINDLTPVSLGGYFSLSKVMARRNEDGSPMGPIEAIFKSWDTYQSFTGQEWKSVTLGEQLIRQTGFELVFLEIFSFRFGRHYEDDDNGARQFWTYGFGFQYKYFSLDYARIDPDERYHPLEDTDFLEITAKIPLDFIR